MSPSLRICFVLLALTPSAWSDDFLVAPTNLTAAPGNGSVVLNWTAPPGRVATYIVVRGLAPGKWQPLANTAALTYSDNTATNGVTYYYAVFALNERNLSDASNQVSATPAGPTGPPTVFVAVLGPQNNQVTPGSGSATLKLASDEKSAILSETYSNLTSTRVAWHIHGPADATQNANILFDLDTAQVMPDGTYLWRLDQSTSYTAEQAANWIKSGLTYLNIHSSRYKNGEIRGQFQQIQGSTTFTPPPDPPALPTGPATLQQAARFLTQATFGPTIESIAEVKNVGIDAYLNSQFEIAAGASKNPTLTIVKQSKTPDFGPDTSTTVGAIWNQWLRGDDQLRQRVAAALSEIMVVSYQKGGSDDPYVLAAYYDLLLRDAFGNFRQLLEDITLNEEMGLFLDMLQNTKEEPDAGLHPNQNYAREIMQLFSIGLNQLNPDGTLKLDANGLPIPTYDVNVILALSRVFTGWSWPSQPSPCDGFYDTRVDPEPDQPMTFCADHHDTRRENPAEWLSHTGASTRPYELRLALDNIFQHPNVGPFISKQLIQRLVTSNPSPGYVYRVASVFNNNGSGVRGDMQAVVRAILTDYEARSTAVFNNQGFGKVKEPMIRYAQILRAFHATAQDGLYGIAYTDQSWALSEGPFGAPSVFNWFRPDFMPAGDLARGGVVAPELQIINETSLIGAANFFGYQIDIDASYADPANPVLNLQPLLVRVNDPVGLVDYLDNLLFADSMSADLRGVLINLLLQYNRDGAGEPLDRVKSILKVAVHSPQFAVQR